MRLVCLHLRMLLVLALGSTCVLQTFGQDPNQTDDVIRVNTAIVQTDVMVFEKSGRFIDGLKRDQFMLKVDGKPREIAFFERITAGSRNEEAQIAAARGGATTAGTSGPVPLDRGRTVFFFVDDFHLSPSSMKQTRQLLSRFIDREMGQNDEIAISSSSGQIGFLQQLTDNKRVLRAAAERLSPRLYTVSDSELPKMSEYQALLIDRLDDDVLDFFIDEMLKRNPGMPRQLAKEMVGARASQMLQQAASITTRTLASLEGLVRTTAKLPGRKVIFLVSDGFLLDLRNSDAHDRLRQITSRAAAAGVVIYSIDARGLSSAMPDAASVAPADLFGRLARSTGGELGASQDGLNALAVDTGGRAFFNTNALSAAVTTALKESSVYYLLAWRPENEEQRTPKLRRIEVSVSGRPDLVVRFRRAVGEVGADSVTRQKNSAPAATPKPPGEHLRTALRAPFPISALPVAVSVHFVDLARSGPTLTTAIRISTNSLVLEPQAGVPTAVVDVMGVVLDDQGKEVSRFDKRLTIRSKSEASTQAPNSILYYHFCVIKPGLYQARVAAYNEKQGRVGSAAHWIEIPDLGSKALTLSSLVVGERKKETENQPPDPNNPPQGEAAGPIKQLSLNIEHRFARSSRLRFVTFIYNASRSSAGTTAPPAPNSGNMPAASVNTIAASSGNDNSLPDLAVQVQVFRDNEPVITTPLHKIGFEGATDPARLPYAAEVLLDSLQPGRYVLQVTVIDRLARASASQQYTFQVD